MTTPIDITGQIAQENRHLFLEATGNKAINTARALLSAAALRPDGTFPSMADHIEARQVAVALLTEAAAVIDRFETDTS